MFRASKEAQAKSLERKKRCESVPDKPPHEGYSMIDKAFSLHSVKKKKKKEEFKTKEGNYHSAILIDLSDDDTEVH